VRVLAFLNIATRGMLEAESEQTLADLKPELAASLAKDFPDIIVGIKSAHYWPRQPWDALHTP
jgi:dihydroorotase